ncbi:hypothetical protein-transmembrane prediction [Rhodopirellula baltica SH 1]|uniref:Uncharacterized protein n=1 Tax=Rhodopirellula baltica (strain DSM 10527 / NCIMB 13988 / SH1) TaxID=243090 RepID=Q7UUZ9_RHOBA|nr:hypothetical protein-transmembrane prediction [Rhodopirellula baltica SH 1]
MNRHWDAEPHWQSSTAAMPHSPMVNHPKRCKRNVLKLDLLSGTLIVIVEVRSTSDHYAHSIHFVRRSAPSRTSAPQRPGAPQAPSGPEPRWASDTEPRTHQRRRSPN